MAPQGGARSGLGPQSQALMWPCPQPWTLRHRGPCRPWGEPGRACADCARTTGSLFRREGCLPSSHLGSWWGCARGCGEWTPGAPPPTLMDGPPPPRPSTMGRSASGHPHSASRSSSTPAPPTCGSRPSTASCWTSPAVSHARGSRPGRPLRGPGSRQRGRGAGGHPTPPPHTHTPRGTALWAGGRGEGSPDPHGPSSAARSHPRATHQHPAPW